MVKKKFEIATLNSENLVELDGFKTSQLKLVKDHPFVMVKDPKSYSEGKASRTALKTGRTTIQNQDKVIASAVKVFRKGTSDKTNELIDIAKPSEDLQQKSIDQWELGIQWCKDIEEIAEAKRIEGIKDKIEEVKKELKVQIDAMTIDSIEDQTMELKLNIEHESNFDFEEFQFLFDEMIIEKNQELLDATIRLEINETTRLEQLAKDQQSKVNEVKLECLELIENVTIATKDTLIESINKICKSDFDFGDFIVQIGKIGTEMIDKSMHKIEWLKAQQEKARLENIQIQKQQVINNREGLLDLVFQMDVDNYTEQTIVIKDAVNQDFEKTVPDAKEEVKKLKDRVNDALKRKLEEIASKLKVAREKEEAEKKQMEETALKIEELHNERIEKVKKLGFIHEKGIISGFGISMDDYEVDECDLFLKDKDFDTLLIELKSVKKTFRENDKKEKARQKRLDPEFKRLESWIDLNLRKTEIPRNLIEPESVEFNKKISSSLDALCDELIEQLKSI